MFSFKRSLIALVCLLVIVGLVTLFAPASTQGQGQGGPPTQNVNVVNNPTVRVSDLYPARPFQRNLVLDLDVANEVCTTIPSDGGLIIELVTIRTVALQDGGGHLLMAMETTAGGETVGHVIPLEKVHVIPAQTHLAVAQSLRAYADAGTQLCFGVVESMGPQLPIRVSVSGQLAPAASSLATPTQ
jgi:hypothetical protein